MDDNWFQRACLPPPFITEQPSHALDDTNTADASGPSRAVFRSRFEVWDVGATITYGFVKGNVKNLAQKIQSCVDDWSLFANIVFKHVAIKENPDIRITCLPGDSPWSNVGKKDILRASGKGDPTMNLCGISDQTAEATLNERRTILHEFGHSLGLEHEHQFPRDGSLTLNETNVKKHYKTKHGWTDEEIQDNVLKKLNASQVEFGFSPWDPQSIMHYSMPAELNNQGREIPANNTLSKLDQAYIAMMYPPNLKTRPDKRESFVEFMNVAKISQQSQATILKYLQDEKLSAARDEYLDDKWMASLALHGLDSNGPARAADPNGTKTGNSDSTASSNWFQRACLNPPLDNEDGRARDLKESVDISEPSRAVFRNLDQLWNPGYTITYGFVDKLSSKFIDNLRLKIEICTQNWSTYANITFRYLDISLNPDVRITFNDHDTSWSYVGRVQVLAYSARNLPTLNFANLNAGSSGATVDEEASILHELGHTLGLRHEHQVLKKRGLRLNEANVMRFYVEERGWTEDRVKDQVLKEYTDDEVQSYSAWDPKSIMQYPMPADLNEQGVEVKRNYTLSELDIAYIAMMYPPNLKRTPNKEKEFIAHMKTTGLPHFEQRAILKELKERDDLEEARKIFRAWRYLVSKGLADDRPAQGLESDKPARDLNAGGTTKKDAPSDRPFLKDLYEKMQQFFNPGGGQIFTLQFPGRFLAQSLYAWDTKAAGIYGHLIKPTIVNENEFRLVDQIYDVAEIVAAPNGVNLSIVYEQMLNNLLPKYNDGGLVRQQAKIRKWLLKDAKVSSWMQKIIAAQGAAHKPASAARTSDNTGKDKPAFAVSDKSNDNINRLELSNALMQDYLMAKQTWELERDALIEESLQYKIGTPESQKQLDALTRRLAHTTAIREAQLANKFADVVVQGFYHNVRQYLGYLDIKSSAEFLQDAKDAFREAAMSSMDGSLNVYPVQLSPIDWFEGLSTSFTVEDLTSDPELIRQAIGAKSNELDSLTLELSRLALGVKGNAEKLEKEVETAQNEVDEATGTLVAQFTQNVISMARTLVDAYGKIKSKSLKDKFGEDPRVTAVKDGLNVLEKGLNDVQGKQIALTGASRKLADALASYALAQATDTQQQQAQIKIRIASIKRDLTELEARYVALRAPEPTTSKPDPKAAAADAADGGLPKHDATAKVEDLKDTSDVNNNTSGGSRWQEFTFTQLVTEDYSKATDSASSRTSSWSCNFFFGSASGSSSQAQGNADAEGLMKGSEMTIGFRATLVTVDRAGWFQPQFFKQSKAYYNINEDLKWTNYPPDIDTPEKLKADPGNFAQASKGLLPAYPVGYIICKDITIKMDFKQSEAKDHSDYFQKKSSTSGGFLCFGGSSSSSESNSNKSHSFFACANGFVIRIPGPQILGYILQLTNKDETSPLPADIPFVFPDEEEEEEVEGDKPARGVETKTLIQKFDDVLKEIGISDEKLEEIHGEMKKELSAIVEGAKS